MCSARLRLPCSITLLTSCVTSTEWWIGSDTRSRRGAGPLRGIVSSLLGLGAVPAPGLLAVLHAGRIERAADDLVPDARQVADATATDEHDGVLLEVVALTGDVGRDLDPARQAHAGDLAEGGVRLLRGVRVHARADAAALGRALE